MGLTRFYESLTNPRWCLLHSARARNERFTETRKGPMRYNSGSICAFRGAFSMQVLSRNGTKRGLRETRKPEGDVLKLSARNTLKGDIISIQPGAVNAIVVIELPDGQLVTSSISIQALKDLDLHVGQQAYAVVKASDVMIGVDE